VGRSGGYFIEWVGGVRSVGVVLRRVENEGVGGYE